MYGELKTPVTIVGGENQWSQLGLLVTKMGRYFQYQTKEKYIDTHRMLMASTLLAEQFIKAFLEG